MTGFKYNLFYERFDWPCNSINLSVKFHVFPAWIGWMELILEQNQTVGNNNSNLDLLNLFCVPDDVVERRN